MGGNLLFNVTEVSNTVSAQSYSGGGGCSNQPSSNNGNCVESTTVGRVTYKCADSSWWQSNNCVKGTGCGC